MLHFGTVKAQTEIPTKKDALDKFGFTEHFIALEHDTISFYIHQKPKSKPKHLVLYLQGTAPDPLFLIKGNEGKFTSYRWTVPGDYELLDEDYVYAVIAKTGIPGVFEVGTKRNVSKYHEFNSLDHRIRTF